MIDLKTVTRPAEPTRLVAFTRTVNAGYKEPLVHMKEAIIRLKNENKSIRERKTLRVAKSTIC